MVDPTGFEQKVLLKMGTVYKHLSPKKYWGENSTNILENHPTYRSPQQHVFFTKSHKKPSYFP